MKFGPTQTAGWVPWRPLVHMPLSRPWRETVVWLFKRLAALSVSACLSVSLSWAYLINSISLSFTASGCCGGGNRVRECLKSVWMTVANPQRSLCNLCPKLALILWISQPWTAKCAYTQKQHTYSYRYKNTPLLLRSWFSLQKTDCLAKLVEVTYFTHYLYMFTVWAHHCVCLYTR